MLLLLDISPDITDYSREKIMDSKRNYSYRYRGRPFDLSKFPNGSGAELADAYIEDLPFECLVTGQISSEDVSKAGAIAKEMRDQSKHWRAYRKQMEKALDAIPEIVEAQNGLRSQMLETATETMRADARLETDGAKHWVEGEKLYQQTHGEIENTLFSGRLASNLLKKKTSHGRAQIQQSNNYAIKFANSQHGRRGKDIKDRYQQKVAALRKERNVYTLTGDEIQYEQI